MKKIRLTESQLIDLIKKSVNKVKTINESQIINEVNYIDSSKLSTLAKNMIKNMSYDVTSSDLRAAIANINAVANLFWDEDRTCAVDKLLAYYKGYNGGTDFLTDLNDSSESNDPEFDDLKAKIPKLITQLKQSCVAEIKKETDAAAAAKTAKDTALSSCASKEPGFYASGNDGWGIKPFGKGWINGYNSGNSTADGYNVWYSYDDKKTNTTKQTQKTKGSCVNGVLNLDAWVKI